MADKTAEQVSAFMDGESEAEEIEFVFRRLGRDSDLKVAWQRYHLIRDAMKSNLPNTLDESFAERIQRAIDEEFPLPKSASNLGFSWYKPAAGFAVAASVAMVITLWAVQGEFPNDASLRLANGVTSAQTQRVDVDPRVVDATDLPSRLNSYFVNHNEYASMNTVYGVLPYARMVGYDTER